MSRKKTPKAQAYRKLRNELFEQFVKVIDGIRIDPEKGVVLTPKKKRQVAKYKKLEKKLVESRQTKKPQK